MELIQSKKRLLNSNVLIGPLFNILKFCLDQDEQSTFEYTKQLVLGCLLDCCKKFETENENVSENNLNVELVIQCLRASPNPQTHHHALMLLSYLSALIPVSFEAGDEYYFVCSTKNDFFFFLDSQQQVMHNVMAIFTFMGTSVARMDDEHSVKVVTQVVETVVPVLVKVSAIIISLFEYHSLFCRSTNNKKKFLGHQCRASRYANSSRRNPKSFRLGGQRHSAASQKTSVLATSIHFAARKLPLDISFASLRKSRHTG